MTRKKVKAMAEGQGPHDVEARCEGYHDPTGVVGCSAAECEM